MRKTPQIPQDVFFEDPATSPPTPATAPVKTSSPQAAKAAKRPEPKPVKRQDVLTSNGQKRQVTIYLSVRALAALERARLDLFVEHGLRVPKSTIAEQAILAAAGDLEALASALRASD